MTSAQIAKLVLDMDRVGDRLFNEMRSPVWKKAINAYRAAIRQIAAETKEPWER